MLWGEKAAKEEQCKKGRPRGQREEEERRPASPLASNALVVPTMKQGT